MSDSDRPKTEDDQELLSAELLSKLYDSDEARRFPLEALPKLIREFVQQQAKALHTPADFVAGPLLVAIGATVGRNRLLQIKKGYEVAPALWLIVVAPSGSAKSPALRKVTDFLRPFDNGIDRLVASDTTIEALAPLLMANPRGLILVIDEMAGWTRTFNQYRGRGADQQKYMSLWSGEKIVIDRKGEFIPTIVEEPFLAIAGTIPPRPLAELVNRASVNSGLTSRFLFCVPDRMPRRYTEDVVEESLLVRMTELFQSLRGLEQKTSQFSPEAKDKWRESATRNCGEINHVPEALRALWSKFESYAGRLILILHAIKEVSDGPGAEVAPSTVEEGWRLVEYFKAHAWRVYHMLGVVSLPSRTESEQKLRDWLARHPEKTEIATRDVLAARIPGIGGAAIAKFHLLKLTMDGVLRMSEDGKKFFPLNSYEGAGHSATQQVSNSADTHDQEESVEDDETDKGEPGAK